MYTHSALASCKPNRTTKRLLNHLGQSSLIVNNLIASQEDVAILHDGVVFIAIENLYRLHNSKHFYYLSSFVDFDPF